MSGADICLAVDTEKGQGVSELFDAARERLAGRPLADWSEQDLKDLTRLLRRFTDNLMRREVPKVPEPRRRAMTMPKPR
jgi:hypothetical protein